MLGSGVGVSVSFGQPFPWPITNNVIDPDDLSTANWSWGDTPGTIAAGDAALISGQTFWEIESGDISTDRRQAIGIPAQTRQHVSVFIKQGNFDYAGFQCHVLGGAVTDVAALQYRFSTEALVSSVAEAMVMNAYGIEDWGNGIFRLWMDFTPGTAGGVGCYILIHEGVPRGS